MPGAKRIVSPLITAEHVSRRVPAVWRHLFAADEAVLATHRAWDPGTRQLARELATALGAPLLEGCVSRLLIDLNRSARHPRLFSEFTRVLPATTRAQLKASYWAPHWQAYRQWLERLPGQVVHIACHSFTPWHRGKPRTDAIGRSLPGLRVRMNDPYRGTSNGLGQQHRQWLPDGRLTTLELEVNQRLVAGDGWGRIRAGLIEAVGDCLRR